MKMKAAHYAILKEAFVVILQAEVKRLSADPEMSQDVKALIEHFFKSYAEGGLSDRRTHFDLFWWVNRRAPEVGSMMTEFYQYANDDHLYTALKALVKELRA